jgi:hypothetical protein
VSDLDDSRELLRTLAGRHAILGKLAAGTISRADLPQLERAAADLGLHTLAAAIGKLAAGQSTTSILAFLVASGDFPDLTERLLTLKDQADDAAAILRALRRA